MYGKVYIDQLRTTINDERLRTGVVEANLKAQIARNRRLVAELLRIYHARSQNIRQRPLEGYRSKAAAFKRPGTIDSQDVEASSIAGGTVPGSATNVGEVQDGVSASLGEETTTSKHGDGEYEASGSMNDDGSWTDNRVRIALMSSTQSFGRLFVMAMVWIAERAFCWTSTRETANASRSDWLETSRIEDPTIEGEAGKAPPKSRGYRQPYVSDEWSDDSDSSKVIADSSTLNVSNSSRTSETSQSPDITQSASTCAAEHDSDESVSTDEGSELPLSFLDRVDLDCLDLADLDLDGLNVDGSDAIGRADQKSTIELELLYDELFQKYSGCKNESEKTSQYVLELEQTLEFKDKKYSAFRDLALKRKKERIDMYEALMQEHSKTSHAARELEDSYKILVAENGLCKDKIKELMDSKTEQNRIYRELAIEYFSCKTHTEEMMARHKAVESELDSLRSLRHSPIPTTGAEFNEGEDYFNRLLAERTFEDIQDSTEISILFSEEAFDQEAERYREREFLMNDLPDTTSDEKLREICKTLQYYYKQSRMAREMHVREMPASITNTELREQYRHLYGEYQALKNDRGTLVMKVKSFQEITVPTLELECMRLREELDRPQRLAQIATQIQNYESSREENDRTRAKERAELEKAKSDISWLQKAYKNAVAEHKKVSEERDKIRSLGEIDKMILTQQCEGLREELERCEYRSSVDDKVVMMHENLHGAHDASIEEESKHLRKEPALLDQGDNERRKHSKRSEDVEQGLDQMKHEKDIQFKHQAASQN